jgi:2-polyprenyl-3-methyl-5-hydroxy-6-metoxy-1,4-benzoquinol methylase
MAENGRGCPLCGSSEQRYFHSGEYQGAFITYVACTSCGLVFQSPAPSQEDLDKFYESQYRLQYQGTEGPTAKDLRNQQGRADSLVNFMRGQVHPGSRHLDIGSSAGVLLREFRERLGTSPVGVEPGRAYRDYAEQQGLKVYPSLEELKAAGEAPLDVISMSHVVEHLTDPVDYLSHLRKALLAPGGRLLLEVPNLYAHNSLELAHLQAYSTHTLMETVRKAGFSVQKLKKHGMPRSRWIPLYITLLAAPDPDASARPVRAERNPRLKRKIGFARRKLLTKLGLPGTWLN